MTEYEEKDLIKSPSTPVRISMNEYHYEEEKPLAENGDSRPESLTESDDGNNATLKSK